MRLRNGSHRAPLPIEYLAVARARDRWFALMMLAAVGTLVVIGLGTLYSAALLGALIPFGLFAYASVRFMRLNQKSGKMLAPWLASHPYRGPASRLLGPMRNIALSHPVPVGTGVGVGLLGLMAWVAFLLTK
jgi:hypothetical protein